MANKRSFTDKRPADTKNDLITSDLKLIESQRMLTTLMNNLPGIAYRCLNDKKWTMEFISSGCRELTGYEAEDLVQNKNLSYNDIIHTEDSESVWEGVQEGVNNHKPYMLTYRIIAKSGKVKWVWEQGTGVFSETGELIALEGFITDISERKHYEMELFESERRLATLMSNLPGMAYRCMNDENWTMEFISDGCFELTGYEAKELIGNSQASYNDIIHHEDRNLIRRLIDESLSHRKPFRIEYRIRTKSGDEKWVWEQGTGVFTETGILDAIEGFITDVTARKNVESELEKYREHLESEVKKRTQELTAANKELETFSYSVSHDLRAPLRAIDGFSKALLEDYHEKLDEEGKDFLARIRSASQRMASLIDDMLKLSRLTRDEIIYVPINLSQLAESIISEFRSSEQRRTVEFINAHDLTVNGDPQLIHAAMENLLGNAWKFTSKKSDAKIEFGVEIVNNEQVFFIRDNGAGFEETYADKLFGAFQRLHTASEFPGTGIGLAIVQRVLNRHGGRIWAQSKVGEGTTFYFTI